MKERKSKESKFVFTFTDGSKAEVYAFTLKSARLLLKKKVPAWKLNQGYEVEEYENQSKVA